MSEIQLNLFLKLANWIFLQLKPFFSPFILEK